MALQTAKFRSIPEGVVAVSEKEAYLHQKSLIQTWPSQYEVLFLKYGQYFSSSLTVATATIITNHYRRFFFIPPKVTFITSLPATFAPAILSFVLTEKVLTKNILLMKVKCPLCNHLKFAAEQLYNGVVFPSLYAFVAFATFADIQKTYLFPSFRNDAKAFWKECFNILNTGSKPVKIASLVQVAVIFFLPYMQEKEFENVMKTVRKNEMNSELLTS